MSSTYMVKERTSPGSPPTTSVGAAVTGASVSGVNERGQPKSKWFGAQSKASNITKLKGKPPPPPKKPIPPKVPRKVHPTASQKSSKVALKKVHHIGSPKKKVLPKLSGKNVAKASVINQKPVVSPGAKHKGRQTKSPPAAKISLTLSSSSITFAELETQPVTVSTPVENAVEDNVQQVEAAPVADRKIMFMQRSIVEDNELIAPMQCWRCGTEAPAKLVGEPTFTTHMVSFLLCAFCLTPLMFMPYWFNCITTPTKRCRRCGAYLTEPPARL